MQVGDLVRVFGTAGQRIHADSHRAGFVTVITEICLPDDQVNKMHMVQVLEAGMKKWYPVGFIKVIHESR